MTMLRNIERRIGTGLSGINDPTMPLYQAIAGLLDGIGGAGSVVPNLPAVNYETALRISSVYRATNIIAGTLGSLPFHVLEDMDDNGAKRVVPSTSPWGWIEGCPNPEVLPPVFWETSLGHCILGGNIFWYAPKDGLGRIAELWPVEPKRVQIARDPESKRKFYVIDGELGSPLADYDPKTGTGEMVHIPAFSLDGTRGINIIRHARLTMQLSMAAEEYGARVFADGSTPGGVITTPANLTPEQARELKARWEQYHRGLQNSHRVAVLDNGAVWSPTKLTLEDAQFLETRKFSVEEVARIFGVPPHLLAHVEGSTSWGKGIEEQGRNMITFTFGPWARRVEAAITYRVLGGQAKLSGAFDLNGLMRGDILQRYRSYGIGRQWGWLSPNDVLRAEGMPTFVGGDDHLTPLNMGAVAPNGTPPPDPLQVDDPGGSDL